MRSTVLTLVAVAGASLASSAMADTVATFADPGSPTAPLFTYNSGTNTLSGSWLGLGLLLQTPGLPSAPDFPNARFTMTPVSLVAPVGSAFQTGPGQIFFTDAANVPLLTITFTGGLLVQQQNFGSSDFTGFNVTFSGPLVAPYPLISNESFSFSFANANPIAPAGSYTVSSSFSSSATLPAPGAASLLGLAGLVVARRRR